MSIFKWNFFYLPFFILGLIIFWLKIVNGNLREPSYSPKLNEKIIGAACALFGFSLSFYSAPRGIIFAFIFLGISLFLFGLNSTNQFYLPTIVLVLFGLNEYFYMEFQQLLLPMSGSFTTVLTAFLTTFFAFLGVNISTITYNTLSGVLTNSSLISFHDLHENPVSVIFNPQCSGIEGVILYTIMCLLILPDLPIKRNKKIIYGVIGFAGSFIINVVRILAIFVAGVLWGLDGVLVFHKIGYGFFVVWSTMFWYIVSKRTLTRGEGNTSQLS